MRLLTILCLLLLSYSANAQFFRTRENIPTGETFYFRYWPGPLMSQLPVYWIFSDTGRIWTIRHDTILLTKFVNKNDDPAGSTVLTVDGTGRLRGTNKSSLLNEIVKYTDTTLMLSPYIRAVDTTAKWAPNLPYLLSFIETDPLSIHISDSSVMLSNYLRKVDTTGKWQFKGSYVFVIDTSNMLTNYLRKVDTTFMMSGYLRKVDTAVMLSGYQRKANIRRVETYLGTTDGSGNYTVTYSPAFSTTPDVQPQLQAGTTQQMVRITSSTTTGFTVNATNRATVTLLSVDVLLGNTTPLVGASVGVLVTSR